MIIELFGLQLQLEAMTYMAEILVAEFVFIYSFDKSRHFVIKIVLLSLLAMVLAMPVKISADSAVIIKFLRFLISVSCGVMLICFKGNPLMIISACTAGIATQHFAIKLLNSLNLLIRVGNRFENGLVYGVVSELIVFGIVYFLAWLIFARPAERYDYKKNGDPRLSVLSAIIVFVCIGINRYAVDFAEGGNEQLVLATNIYAMTCCAFALVIQFNLNRWNRDKTELQVTQRLLKDEKKQYDQWVQSIDLVNIRFHDIKHMLTDIKEIVAAKDIDCPNLSTIENAVNSFGSRIRTGNDVLDIMLGNMSEYCANNNIQFSCMASIESLKNADGMKLYSLFVNAIDNAVASVAKIADEDKRIIDLSIKEFGESVIIHIWNYFTGEITFRDGLPVSDGDSEVHGYGMKSMKMVVEQEGGTIKAYTKGEVFNLDIILPIDKP